MISLKFWLCVSEFRADASLTMIPAREVTYNYRRHFRDNLQRRVDKVT